MDILILIREKRQFSFIAEGNHKYILRSHFRLIIIYLTAKRLTSIIDTYDAEHSDTNYSYNLY